VYVNRVQVEIPFIIKKGLSSQRDFDPAGNSQILLSYSKFYRLIRFGTKEIVIILMMEAEKIAISTQESSYN